MKQMIWMRGKQMGKNEALDMVRAINEMTKGFKEVAPLFHQVLSSMRDCVNGRDTMGYFSAADMIDNASVDEKDIMLLLSTQWMAQVLEAARTNDKLRRALMEVFPNSVLLKDM